MSYIAIKSIHIIAVISWFAALFYQVRIYIYHSEAVDKSEIEKNAVQATLLKMARMLMFAISFPAAILTLLTGIEMIRQMDWIFETWLVVKLTLVSLLVWYQIYCLTYYKSMIAGKIPAKSATLRMINEVPTIVLVGVVFLVETKSVESGIRATLVILALLGTFFLLRIFKKKKKD